MEVQLDYPDYLHPDHKKDNSTTENNKNHPTSIGFAENQLSLSLISLSPLITDHPRILQHPQVRPSNQKIIGLPIIRSLSFGSY